MPGLTISTPSRGMLRRASHGSAAPAQTTRAKGPLFDGRLTHDADAYYPVWAKLQVANTTTDGAFRYTGDAGERGSADTQLHAANPCNGHLASCMMFNLRLGVANKDWSGTFFVRNLTNKRAQIDAINSSQDPTGLLTVRPRTIGATVTRSF